MALNFQNAVISQFRITLKQYKESKNVQNCNDLGELIKFPIIEEKEATY